MIIDLTQQLKTQFSKYPAADNQKTTWFKVSPHFKLYTTYSEDIYQSLMKIRTILNQSRENYFSNASYSFEAFTENQREELNTNIRSNLQSVANQINELSEGLKKQTNYKRKTQQHHLNAVVMCLYQLLKSTQSTFAQFQQFSLKRRKKIEQTIAFDKIAEKGRYSTPSVRTSRQRETTDEELQKQSGLLLVTKISKQKELQQTKKQIESIHEIMTNMSNVVLEQEFQTSAFLQIGETGLFHIERGNKNLVEANILAKATGKWWSLLFLSMALSLLILDFLKS